MTNGVATAALVFGIAGVVLLWVPVLGVVLGIVALILGMTGLKKANADSKREGRGYAIAGIVMGGIAIIFGLVWIGLLAYFGTLQPSGGECFVSKCITSNPNIYCRGGKALISDSNFTVVLYVASSYPTLEFGKVSQIPVSILINSKNNTVDFTQTQGPGRGVATNSSFANISSDQDITINLDCSKHNCIGKPNQRTRLEFTLLPINIDTRNTDPIIVSIIDCIR